MPITIEVDGVEYGNFTNASVNIALDTLANDFTFDAVTPEDSFLPFFGGESCRILVDGNVVQTGFIENIEGSYSGESHIVNISGRDKTADLIDSTIGALNDIRAPITLKELIERVIAHIGSDIQVVDNTSPEPFNKAEDIVAATPGDNAFAFIEGYAQKRQVLLTSNADGNVVITNSEPTRSTGALQHVIGVDDNNVLNASWSYRTGGLFNKYIQLGQQDPVALTIAGSTTDDGIVSQGGQATDNSGAMKDRGRQLVMVADKGFSQEQLQKRAEWSKKIRNARSTLYSATVQGFSDEKGNIWAINQLVPVVDEFADINRELLINTITFAYGAEIGSLTTLGFVEANAYRLLTQEPVPVGTDQDAFIL